MKMIDHLWRVTLAGLFLTLTACNRAAPVEMPAPSPSPIAVAASPTVPPTPAPTFTSTSKPATVTPAPPPPSAIPTSAATEVPAEVLTGQLQATLEANLPPSPTPAADGFTMGGFEGVTVLPLTWSSSDLRYWVAFTHGPRIYDPLQNHFVAIYTQNDGGWQEVSRLELENPDYLDPASVTEAKVEPGHLWLEVQGGAGAHAGTYDLLSFDGQTLRSEATQVSASAGAGRLEDLNGDGLLDVILDQTDYYVFCFACGVRFVQYQVLSWDGQHLSPISLSTLAESAPAKLRELTNRAAELAQAGLWRDAEETINQAVTLDAKDPIVTWDAALIRLHAQAQAPQDQSPYPLLENVLYGDYTAALEAMRPYSMGEIFGQPTPLITDTPAMGWEAELSQRIIDSSTKALQVQPELAAAFYLRGWARHLANPDDPQAVADIEQAAKLDPQEPLFSQSLTYLKR